MPITTMAEGATVWDFVLELNAMGGPLIIAMYALAALVFLYLLFRGSGWSWVLTLIVLVIVGALIGIAVLWIAVNLFDALGGPVAETAWLWMATAFAGITVAIWNLWHSRWWRKVIALLAIPLFAATAWTGVNAASGSLPIDAPTPSVSPSPTTTGTP